MTTETAAEMLYDEYTGTTGRFQTSTQKDRWLAFTAKVVAAAQPAPVGVIDREAIARAINPRPWSEHFTPFRCHGDDRTTKQLIEEERDKVRQTADAVLAVLPGLTVAQVKAEALREAAAIATYGDTQRWLNARADELEREDKR